MKSLFLALVVLVSPLAMAKAPTGTFTACDWRMYNKLKRNRENGMKVHDALQRLRDLGLKKLLKDVDDGEVEVQFKTPWLPLMQDPVSARISILNQKYLVIRQVDVSTPERKDLFVWRVALALYELQQEPALWSSEALFPQDLPAHEDARSFWARTPQAWANERMKVVKDLLEELYTLFDNLPNIAPDTILPPTDRTGELYDQVHKALHIKPETAMPEKDPGLYWRVKAMVLRDASQDIGPNIEDYNRWRVDGRGPVDRMLDTRHARSTLFNYYMNHVKRMLMVTSLLSTLAWSPHLLEIPSYIETHHIDVERAHQLSTAELRNDDIERRSHEIYVENQIQEINASLTAEENAIKPNPVTIANLKKTLQALVDKNPGSIYMTENGAPR